MPDDPQTSVRRPLALILTEDRAALAGFAGAVAVLVGSLLTWAVVPLGLGTVSVSGIEADGKVTLVLGVVALMLLGASLRVAGRDLPLVAAAVGVAAAGIAVMYLRDLETATARVLRRLLEVDAELDPAAVASRFGADAGPGVWIVLAGGVLVAAGAVALALRDRRRVT